MLPAQSSLQSSQSPGLAARVRLQLLDPHALLEGLQIDRRRANVETKQQLLVCAVVPGRRAGTRSCCRSCGARRAEIALGAQLIAAKKTIVAPENTKKKEKRKQK